MQTHERIGHGYILKRSKLASNWLIDPFVLRTDQKSLILDRTARRVHFMTERPYLLVNLGVDELRKLSTEELKALEDDVDFSRRLSDIENSSKLQCFGVTFSDNNNKSKSLTIVAPLVETVEHLHRVMLEHAAKCTNENGPTVDQLLGPCLRSNTSDPQMMVTHKLTMIYDDKEPPQTVLEQKHNVNI